MKNFLRSLLILAFISLFIACSNNDDDNNDSINFTSEFLQQSAWRGEITNPGGTGDKEKVGVEFTGLERGIMEITKFTDSGDEYVFGTSLFTYKIKGKSMSIVIEWPVYSGYWLLKEQTKDKLVLVIHAGSETKSYVMTLHRVL